MITLKKMPYFDYKYVVIGKLVDGKHSELILIGESTLQAIEKVECLYEVPKADIEITTISECL
jgi:cyclophilin family peptidyl-prolyl cis-trans isomerase